MAAALKKLEEQALKLPARLRARLAERLIASLDGATDADAEELWIVQAERRVAEVATGKVEGVPAGRALRKAHSALRQRVKPFEYLVSVEWSEDEAFVARVPALPGCAAHGTTPERSTREAINAAGAILESMRAHGQPLPAKDVTSRHSGQLRLRLPRSLHARLSRLAALDGLSLNQELVALLAEGAGAGSRSPNRNRRANPARQPPRRAVAGAR